MAQTTSEQCSICLGSMKAGEGRALYTAECSHTFHYACITYNVQHGNRVCPTCNSYWKNPPFFNDPSRPHIEHPVHPRRFPFADDEPLGSLPPTTAASASTKQGEKMTVKAFPEYPALSRSDQSESFAVLVGIQAPSLLVEGSENTEERAPIDLVAVLDVSGSMTGSKIILLKQAMGFVINNLSPKDRLSVITFSTSASRVTPLRRMTDTGKSNSVLDVNSLRANGATNIIAGLKIAVEVLEQRRQKNPVCSIILLSDGQDNQNGVGHGFLRALRLLPACIRSNDTDSANSAPVNDAVPVHTFGFGSDHDATALHAIADGSHGTFSYIESLGVIQDAFAQCIGGLLSVVAQQVEIQVASASPEVLIQSIPSGRHRNSIGSSKQHGVIYIGDVYAEEEKQFLVYLSIPTADAGTLTTPLLEVKCSYKDPLSKESIMTETVEVEIRRPSPEDLSDTDKQACAEVKREKNRVSVAEGISKALAMAESGELKAAHSYLEQHCMVLKEESADGGDDCEVELRNMQPMLANSNVYNQTGRAFFRSKIISHGYQRAATQAAQHYCAGVDNLNYKTSNMIRMVKQSQSVRLHNDDDQAHQSDNTKNTK